MRVPVALVAGTMLAIAIAMPVSADGHTIRQSGSAINSFPESVCEGFTIEATLYQTWTENDRLTRDGTPVAAEVQMVQYFVLSANGKTITSVPTHEAVHLRFDSQGNPVSWIETGVHATFRLPDGSFAHWAGHLDDFALTLTGVKHTDAICTYLA